MSKANVANARVIKHVIDDFCSSSGLNLNLTKYKVFFSKSGGAELKRAITDILGFTQTPNLGKYLGIYMRHGRVSRADAGRLIDKVTSRYAGWKKKFLSTAGRATLIQAVTSSVPLYDMQSSWLPEHVCNRLDKLNRDFLWSNDVSQRKTHLVGWKKVVLPKAAGGLGLREARTNNEAMLPKIIWKTARKEKSIWMELVQQKYLKGRNILHYSSKPGDSLMWKGVVKCADKLNSCFRWQVGDSSSITFLLDRWYKDRRLFEDLGIVDKRDYEIRLNQVLHEDGEWDFSVCIPFSRNGSKMSSKIRIQYCLIGVIGSFGMGQHRETSHVNRHIKSCINRIMVSRY